MFRLVRSEWIALGISNLGNCLAVLVESMGVVVIYSSSIRVAIDIPNYVFIPVTYYPHLNLEISYPIPSMISPRTLVQTSIQLLHQKKPNSSRAKGPSPIILRRTKPRAQSNEYDEDNRSR